MRHRILFIHGAFSHGGHFDAWRRYFSAAGYECAAPSLPGHGAADAHRLATLDLEDYCAALTPEWQGEEALILIGHSMGGLIAQHLAQRLPCAALVLVASAPPWILPAQGRALPYLLPMMPSILMGRPLKPAAKVLRNLVLQDLPEAERQALVPTFTGESGRAYRAMVLGAVALTGPAFSGPVLCLSGRADRIIPTRTSEALARFYSAAHRPFAARGHWLIAASGVDDVAAAALRWLDEVLGGAPAATAPSVH